MPRKIVLDKNVNDGPSLPFAIFLCLIPITTFFYMKQRQRNRYSQVPGRTGDPAPSRGSRSGEPAGDAETQKKEKDKIERDKKKWEDKVAAEKKRTEEEKEKRTKAEQTAAALKRELMDAKAKIKEGRYKLDLAEHPNDPFVDDQTPDEVFNRVKPLNPNPAPPAKSAVRNGLLFGQDPGNPLHPNKGVVWKNSNDKYKHAVDRIATFRKDGGPGFAEHDISLHVPRIQKENPYSTYIEDKEVKSGRHLCNDQYKGSALQGKTDELKKLLPEATSAIFQKAANIANAQKGSAQYEEAMADTRDDDHGTYPSFASAPIGAIVGLLAENDVPTILQGMLVMKDKIERGDKNPNGLLDRYCLPKEALDRKTMTFLWFLDSFRVVSSLCRMNIIQGEPEHLEKRLGLKFILFEWLEIFGIQCAQQRLLSPAGFDLAGLCIRLHCLPVVKEPKELRLIVTIYLPGGADRVDEKGKKMENWAMRMDLAVRSWREVWAFLSMQTGAEGRNWGHEAFKERELVFSPGFAFEGIKQAGGPPTVASPDAEPNNRYNPILNAFTPPKWPYPGHMLINFGHRLVPMIRPTTIVFKRRRQFTWAHTSLTKTSHDFEDGMIALCLDTIDPQHWKQGAVSAYPDEITDDNLEVRLQDDEVKIIKFNSTIPMTMDKKNKPIGFPDVTIHPKLDGIYMTYVAMTRQTDGSPSAGAKIPATATLVLASELGLWTLLHRKDVPGKAKKVTLYVDIKGGDVQQFADELLETLIVLGKKKFGAGWSGNSEAIDRDAKEDRDVLRQVHCQLENDLTFPISQKILGIAWDSN